MTLEPRGRNFPDRPRRLDSLFSSVRPFYFVTFNTHKRQALLTCDDIHECFRGFCLRAHDRDVAVGKYVLMPDHVHFFVALPTTEITLPAWIQMLKTVLGKTLLRLGNQKPHWQEGFF
jgi:putative transposase